MQREVALSADMYLGDIGIPAVWAGRHDPRIPHSDLEYVWSGRHSLIDRKEARIMVILVDRNPYGTLPRS